MASYDRSDSSRTHSDQDSPTKTFLNRNPIENPKQDSKRHNTEGTLPYMGPDGRSQPHSGSLPVLHSSISYEGRSLSPIRDTSETKVPSRPQTPKGGSRSQTPVGKPSSGSRPQTPTGTPVGTPKAVRKVGTIRQESNSSDNKGEIRKCFVGSEWQE